MSNEKKGLQERSLIVQTLSKAGWNETDKMRVFTNKANMEYQNGTLNLEIDYDEEDHSIYFSIYEYTGKGIDLVIYFEDKLQKLLNTIISFQDVISPDNFKDYIGKILEVCPSTYVDTGEQMVPLIDEIENVQRKNDRATTERQRYFYK